MPKATPVAGTPIKFTAPVAGASGRFTVPARDPHHDRARFSHPYTVEVPTDACGIAVAPVFTANHIDGGYIVEATVEHVRPAAFALVNEAGGHSYERARSISPSPDPPTWHPEAAAVRSRARGELRAAHEAHACRALGAGDRDRRGRDRGRARTVLVEPSRLLSEIERLGRTC